MPLLEVFSDSEGKVHRIKLETCKLHVLSQNQVDCIMIYGVSLLSKCSYNSTIWTSASGSW